MSRFFEAAGEPRSPRDERRGRSRRRGLSFRPGDEGGRGRARGHALLESLERRLLLTSTIDLNGGAASVDFAATWTETPEGMADVPVAIADSTNATVATDNDATITAASVTILSTTRTDTDTLAFGAVVQANGLTTTTTRDSVAGTVTLALNIDPGTPLSPDLVQSIFRTATFTSTSRDPGAAARSIRFQVADSDGGQSQATTTLSVATANDAPQQKPGTGAIADLLLKQSGSPQATALLPGTLDYTPVEAGQTLTYMVTVVPDAALGRVFFAVDSNTTTVVANQAYTLDQLRAMQFQAAVNGSGTGSFRFTVKDDGGTSNGGVDTLTQSVAIAVNKPPVVSDTTYYLAQSGSTPTAIDLKALVAADDETSAANMTFAIVTAPAMGTTGTIANGVVNYTPTTPGTFTLTFTATDRGNPDGTTPGSNALASNTGTITLYVNGPPTATDGSASLFLTGTQRIDLRPLVGDDATSDSQLTYTVSQPASGLLAPVPGMGNNGLFNYTPAAAGVFTFTFSVTDDGNPAGSANALASNTATFTITVQNMVDVKVEYADASGTALANQSTTPAVLVGENLVYYVKVSNLGPGAATGVTLTDALPAGVALVDASVVSGHAAAPTANGGTVTSAVGTVVGGNRTLLSGDSALFRIVVRPQAGAAASITNVASVNHLEADQAAGNDSKSIDTTVARLVFQAVSPVNEGSPLVDGTSILTPVPLTMTLSADLGRDVTVTVATVAGGTATPGAAVGIGVDYLSFSRAFTIRNAGDYAIVDAMMNPLVRVVGDAITEPDEAFLVRSSYSPAGISGLPAPPAVTDTTSITIVDDDSTVVTSTSPTGPGSLFAAVQTANKSYEALVAANLPASPIAIKFAAGLTQVQVDRTLVITAPVVLDGLVTAGSITIVPAGGFLGTALQVDGPDGGPSSTLENMAIQGFGGGILVTGGGGHLVFANSVSSTVAGSWGLTIRGSSDNVVRKNRFSQLAGNAVVIDGSGAATTGNTIGSLAINDGNTILFNTGDGIRITGANASGNRLLGNTIRGTNDLMLGGGPSNGIAILAGAHDNLIGVDKLGLAGDPAINTAPNVVTANTGDGIFIGSIAGNTIGQNSIYENAGLGIELAGGTNPPARPTPVFSGASARSFDKSVNFLGTLTGPAGTYRIDFYTNIVQNPDETDLSQLQPYPQGRFYVDSINVTLNFDGDTQPISYSKSSLLVQAKQFATATATYVAGAGHQIAPGDTSGFSAPFKVTDGLTVTNTADSGAGSLREAITTANRSATDQTIGFQIDTSSPANATTAAGRPIIYLLSPLDPIVRSVTIDGFTQLRGGSPPVVLDGSMLPAPASGSADARIGLVIQGDTSSSIFVKGLVFQNFAGAGIDVEGGKSVAISSSYFGTDETGGQIGTIRGGTGIRIGATGTVTDVTIGGDQATDGNVIAGFVGQGIAVGAMATGVLLKNNRIGTDLGGTRALANGTGVVVDSATGVKIVANLIAGNTGDGIRATGGASLEITSNSVGTQAGGLAGLANQGDGIDLTGVAGASLVGNLIAASGQYGIRATGGTGLAISGNTIGLRADSGGTLPNLSGGILLVGAQSATIGGANDADRNIIAGNQGAGIEIRGDAAQPTPAVVAVLGNILGTTARQDQAFGNQGVGIAIHGPNTRVTVGSNIVVRSTSHGIEVVGAANTTIVGNLIGLNERNQAAGNLGDGIRISDAPATTVGGATTADRNTIAASGQHGVEIVGALATNVAILGNFLGVNVAGTSGDRTLANALDGIRVVGSPAVSLGSNLIAGSDGYGIAIVGGADRVSITGNVLGVGLDGNIGSTVVNQVTTNTLYNTRGGILLDGATRATVDGNTVSNSGTGAVTANGIAVLQSSTGALIRNNNIGTDPAGGLGRGNLGLGILVQISGVGATGDGATIENNLISANTRGGVRIVDTGFTTLRSNRIGTDQTGSRRLGNSAGGVIIDNSPNTTLTGNTISANLGFGVDVNGSAPATTSGLTLTGNLIGTDPTGQLGLGNGSGGVSIRGNDDPTSASYVAPQIVGNTISGNGDVSDLSGGGLGLIVVTTPGLVLASNRIGVSKSGDSSLPNALGGVRITDSASVVIGGLTADLGNTISGNGAGASATAFGLRIEAPAPGRADGALIGNNRIGTDSNGGLARANNGDGVVLDGAGHAVIVNNVIAGNKANGLRLIHADDAVIAANAIGTDLGANLALGNTLAGILVQNAAGVTIGQVLVPGIGSFAGNVVAANGTGITIVGDAPVARGAVLLSNTIGTNSRDAAGLGNVGSGVEIRGASGVLIRSNTVASNLGAGIRATNAAGLVIDGVTLGTSPTNPATVLGNGGVGIQFLLDTATLDPAVSYDLTIRGTQISNSGADGIQIGRTPGAPGAAPPVASSIMITQTGVAGSLGDGIDVADVRNVQIDHGSILNSRGVGVSLARIGAASVLASQIASSSGSGLVVADSAGAAVTIDTNRVNSSGSLAISLDKVATATLNANSIDFSGATSVSVTNASGAVAVTGNTLASQTGTGIVVATLGSAVITDNTINSSGLDAIDVLDAPMGVTVSRNVVRNSVGNGINLTGSAFAVVEDNNAPTLGTVVLGGLKNIRITGGFATISVKRNTLIGLAGGAAIDLVEIPSAAITVDANTITGGFDGVSIDTATSATVTNSTIARSFNMGIVITDVSSSVTVASNSLTGIARAAVSIASTPSAVVDSNTISLSGGIAIQSAATVVVTNNTATSTLLDAIDVTDASQSVRVASNTINGSLQAGVSVANTPSAVIDSNAISGCVLDGITTAGAASVQVTNNTNISGNGGGIRVAGASLGARIASNTLDHNGQGGIIVSGSASATIVSNVVGATASTGVSVAGTPIVAVDSNTIRASLAQGLSVDTAAASLHVGDNVVASGSGDGIAITDSPNATIERNDVESNGGNGLTLHGVALNNVSVARNTFNLNQGNGLAIVAAPAAGAVASVTVQSNTVAGNLGNGIQVAGSSGVRLIGNQIGVAAGNRLDGILLSNGTSATLVMNNTVANGGAHGIELSAASGNDDAHGGGIVGNTITRNLGNGLRILAGSSNNLIQANFIGTDATSAVLGNSSDGVLIQGQATAGNRLDANTIAANGGSGVLIGAGATGNTLSGNQIGLPGPPDLANSNDGVTILQAGAANQLAGNAILRNNNNGVFISETGGTLLDGNFIGTDASGGSNLGNRNTGLVVDGSAGTTIRGNTISGNQSHGVAITGKSSATALVGNRIGTDPTGTRGIGNKLDGILLVNASDNFIGIPGQGGNIIAANESNGVLIFQGQRNILVGNRIGTDGSTTRALGNKGDGILLVDSSDNTIGGAGTDANVVSANQLSGLELLGGVAAVPGEVNLTTADQDLTASRNLIQFNIFGTLQAGQAATLGNKLDGVRIAGTTSTAIDNRIVSNAIAGNQNNGVSITSALGTAFAGNTVGVAGLGNANDGVSLTTTLSTLIDGGNVFSYNGRNGATIAGSAGTIVQGSVFASNKRDGIDVFNSTGTLIRGTTVASNEADGIRIEQGSQATTVGSAGSAPNLIDFNRVAGIEITSGSTATVVRNSRIGLADDPNQAQNTFGILLNGVAGNDIGDPAAPNVLSGNVQAGVQIIAGSTNNTVHDNLIGLSVAGDAAVLHPDGRGSLRVQQNGIYVQDSGANTLTSNHIAGNAQAGIQIFGQLSTGNVVISNIIGSDLAGQRPIAIGLPGDPSTATDVYGVANRQFRGIWINNSGSNVIGGPGRGNQIYANQNGIVLDGVLTTNNQIVGNVIGPDPARVSSSLKEQLGNFIGIDVTGAAANTIVSNLIRANISVGIVLENSAKGNVVQKNQISSNGGFAEREALANGGLRLAQRALGTRIYGVGIYIDGASGNVIGNPIRATGKKGKPVTGQGNTIDRNILAGVYLVNGAIGNPIAGNRIFGGGQGFGEYGIFLYNSAGNLVSIAQAGPGRNNIRNNFVAQLREFTGPLLNGVQLTTAQDIPGGGRKARGGGKPSSAQHSGQIKKAAISQKHHTSRSASSPKGPRNPALAGHGA